MTTLAIVKSLLVLLITISPRNVLFLLIYNVDKVERFGSKGNNQSCIGDPFVPTVKIN